MDFKTFVTNINPSETTISEVSRLHSNLREHLKKCDTYKEICTDTYLSGSYAKHTFIRPKLGSESCDIDIVVETSHSTNERPSDVIYELNEAIRRHSNFNDTRIQTHSVGVDTSRFHIDVVPLVKGKDGGLYIGSSSSGIWKKTNPKLHIAWSEEVNKKFDSNFKPLVKIMKWWRRQNCPSSVKFPKGITLEKIIADNLPELGLSTEECVMQTMANISVAYAEDISSQRVPFIEDPVLKGSNLAEKYSYSDFVQFAEILEKHLALLAECQSTNETWRAILGNNFPVGCPTNKQLSLKSINDQEEALRVKHRQKLKYPIQPPKPNATITATVEYPSGFTSVISNDGPALPKGSEIIFKVNCCPVHGGTIMWQVTNTGEEAMRKCKRGGFEPRNEGVSSRRETTAYTGKHYVQCFVVKNELCIRWSNPFFINVE